MAEIINLQNINPNTFEIQTYSLEDNALISSTSADSTFSSSIDIVEYFIYDLNKNILFENVNGYPSYYINNNIITLTPEENLKDAGFTEGNYNTLYNFLRPKLGSNSLNRYFISEISSDRTEIRLDTTVIPNSVVVSSTNELSNEISTTVGSYYDFYLDFGNNQLIIANNVLLDNSNPDNPTVLIKLYEALPQQFTLKNELWAVIKVLESVAYNISIINTFDVLDNNIYLKGPNTNLNIKDQINNSTDYINSANLTTTNSSQGSGSFQYQLNSLLVETGIEINIDYSDYSNFIHFSSAQTRLENFYYKLSLIEQYNYSASLSSGTSTNYYVSSSNVVYQNKIDDIITNFDGYEYFLYYESGSTCWPKTGNTPPYTNYSTTSTSGSNWLISQSLVAENYDLENNNALTLAIPSYISEDPDNLQFELFVEMIGQSFDSVFVYLQDITNKYNADNRLNYGVSKELVADILRDMGIKIYQNNFSSNDLYSALIGFTPSGSLYNLPYTTTQLPVPANTFLEYIDTYITASATGSLIPTEDINFETYKRIYANLPLLLKKKGSTQGLRNLITTFGIPDTILRVNEFGGQDKNFSTFNQWQNEFNYAYTASGNNYVSASWLLNSNWGAANNVPNTVEFRFKTNGLPTSSIAYSQSLWSMTNTVGTNLIGLEYTGSGYITGSYSGAPINPYYQYAKLVYYPDTSNTTDTASVYLPFYDGGWWSVMLTRNGNTFTLYAGNKNTEVNENTINFQASASIITSSGDWITTTSAQSYLGYSAALNFTKFSGSLQEWRYYSVPCSQSTFDAYVMNPYSIEQSEYLAFRASLGGELYTSSISIHPKITGSWITTSSFSSNSNFNSFNPITYTSNTEFIYFDQVVAGIQNIVSNKLQTQNLILPYSGSNNSNIPNNLVLSPYISIQQSNPVSSSYSRNVDYVEIGFSPQNEINEDINSSLGFFNIGEYIGDPRQVSSSADSYPDLNTLRDSYFLKYFQNYQEWDYVRLIQFFDNSLFKMVADFVPARTSLAAGIIVKQHLLERNKYPVPQANISTSIANIASGSTNIPFVQQNILFTGSIPIEEISAGNGGVYDDLFITSTSTFTFITSSVVLSGLSPSTYTYVANLTESGQYRIQVTATDTPTATIFNIYDGNTITGTNIYSDYNTSFDIYLDVILTNNFITFENFNGPSGEILTLNNVVIQRQVPPLTNLNQVWTGSTMGPLGPVTFTDSYQYEFFDGELSGSVITVTTQSLNPDNILLDNQAFYPTIADYQNLNVNTSGSVSGSGPFSVILPFNNLQRYIDYYNTSTYQYKPNYTTAANVSFYITASLNGSASALLQDLNISLYKDNNLLISGLITSSFFSPSPASFQTQINKTITFDDIPFISGSTYSLFLENSNNLLITSSFNSASNWTISVVNPQVIGYPNDPNIFQQSTFPGNLELYPDYNAILNNVYSNRLSDQYFDVDYSQQGLLPVNQAVIISQSAVYAQVQDSNYTLARSINPRYVGSKNISAKYNVYTVGDSSYGKQAAIDDYVNYFVYFDWIGRSNPEYPGGGNFHLTYLVDIEGKATPLTGDNTNLFTVSNIFIKGQTATILPTVYSVGTNNPVVTIAEGGALIDTIVFRSGSASSTFTNGYISGSLNSIVGYLTSSFSQSSTTLLTDSGSISLNSMGWLYPFLTPSSSISGTLNPDISFLYDQVLSSIKIINKSTIAAFEVQEGTDNDVWVPYSNTYLPLQQYDYIRFGTTDMDTSFTGEGLTQITNILTGSDIRTSSSIFVTSITLPTTDPLTQNWRIFRRVPKDNFVLVQNMPLYTDSGLLIPQNFNPNYDPYTLARKAGLVQ
jgi:hypothetical protein